MTQTIPLGRDQKIALLSEIMMLEHLVKSRVDVSFSNGMTLPHLSVLNHLGHIHQERTPSQLAKTFSVTRGAMTNTLNKLQRAGYVNIRPDWDDARKKLISISPAGLAAREEGLARIDARLQMLVPEIDAPQLRSCLSVLRQLRTTLSQM